MGYFYYLVPKKKKKNQSFSGNKMLHGNNLKEQSARIIFLKIFAYLMD